MLESDGGLSETNRTTAHINSFSADFQESSHSIINQERCAKLIPHLRRNRTQNAEVKSLSPEVKRYQGNQMIQ